MTGDHEHTVHMHMRMHMLITPCVGRWVIGFGLGVRLVRRATTGAAGERTQVNSESLSSWAMRT